MISRRRLFRGIFASAVLVVAQRTGLAQTALRLADTESDALPACDTFDRAGGSLGSYWFLIPSQDGQLSVYHGDRLVWMTEDSTKIGDMIRFEASWESMSVYINERKQPLRPGDTQ